MGKETKPFQLNFSSDKKVVSVTLLDDDGIFQLANMFKSLLDNAGIANTLTESIVEDAKQISENIGDKE